MCGGEFGRENLIEKLKRNLGKRVKLAFQDGEELVADVDLVLEKEDAIVFDLVMSNRPNKYEQTDKPPHIFANVSQIVGFEEIPEAGH